MNRRAFTLLELIIVVLITGILAVVAMPEYQKAMRRSMCVEAYNVFAAIKVSQEVYFVENQTYASDISDFDVIMPPQTSRYFEYGIKLPAIPLPQDQDTDWVDIGPSDDYCIAAWRDVGTSPPYFPEHPHMHKDGEPAIYMVPEEEMYTTNYPPVAHSHGSTTHTHCLWATPEVIE
ncbi:MAG: prepilin-type N-terminal cleavage/methylation domain-containing protein [Candidatus Omnitrophica bacterium]|nr:prepilin-type N-terminal cleavage/methylation domain-containing protein [Candidatus Omnitrophota bacterium]